MADGLLPGACHQGSSLQWTLFFVAIEIPLIKNYIFFEIIVESAFQPEKEHRKVFSEKEGIGSGI